MSDDKISANRSVDRALHLDGDAQSLGRYYDHWAADYDRDMDDVEYAGPAIGTRLLNQYLGDKADAKLLDAGCGTGLVGQALAASGYRRIHGFDLSESMAHKARETGCYRQVLGGLDIMQAAEGVDTRDFDALICIGVFTLGHLPPQAMLPLVELVRPGGLLVVSTRKLYYDESDFQAVVGGLVDDGVLKLIQLIKDAPYNKDGLAHYWVFRN